MAPLDPDTTSRSNALPLLNFGSQIALVAGLTTHILLTIRHAARSLTPPVSTRLQEPVRRRNVAIFSALAFLSFASVTTFAVAWRVLSYFEWAEKGAHESPGTIWNGWYGTGEEGVGRWRLGDWWSDVDLIDREEAESLAAPEAFLYLYQHFSGLAAAAIFYGVEGRRRNLPTATIASFVALSEIGSLGFALSLFFVTLLFTPVAIHSDDTPRHDALFTPHPAVLYVPVVVALGVLQYFPTLLAKRADITLFRVGYLVVPLFLAFAPQIIPVSWGHHHTSKAAAHRSFDRVFFVLGITSLLLHWKIFTTSLLVNTPPARSQVYDLFRNAIGKQPEPNRFYTALSTTAQKLKLISSHPAVTVTGNDVAVTAIALLTWTFVRQLDVGNLLDNSPLAFLQQNNKADKHVAFEDETNHKVEEETEEDHLLQTPKKRGRPKKSPSSIDGDAAPTLSTASTGTLRRSTRRKTRNHHDYESDAESTYEPSAETRKAVKQTETDVTNSSSSGVLGAEDVIAGGESTALALLLAFTGGLGQLAAGVLGAEVTAAGD